MDIRCRNKFLQANVDDILAKQDYVMFLTDLDPNWNSISAEYNLSLWKIYGTVVITYEIPN